MVERTREATMKAWSKIRRRPIQVIVALLVIAGGITTVLVAGAQSPSAYSGCGYGYSGSGDTGYAFGYGTCPPSATTTTTTTTTTTVPVTPPASNPCASYTGNDAFLCSAYEDLLGRAPESAGLAFWSAQLAGGASRNTVAYDIATTPEYRSHLISGYYEAFLGRAPESGGLSYWVAQLNGGASDQSVLAAILGSGEFYADSGGTPSGFVTALYTKLLGRAPESGGLAFWENQLSSGAARSAVAAGILSSTEYRSDFVEAQYLHLLGRGADAGGLSYWVAQLAGGASNESVIAGFVGSPEFYTDATS